MITWPASLPNPNRAFQIGTKSSVVRTRMDSGRNRQRKRFSKQFRIIQVQWLFTDDEYGIFQSIHHHLLEDGASWFTMSMPLGGGGFQSYTVRFISDDDTYDADYDDVLYWTVSARIETEDETSPLTAEEAQFFVDLGEDSIATLEAAVDSYNTYINETLASTLY